jgi:ABC-type branched-subunit amino acid transport system ATPase component
MAGLTSTEIKEALEIIKGLRRGYKLVVVEHIMEAIIPLRLGLGLAGGVKIAEGTPGRSSWTSRLLRPTGSQVTED